MSQYGTLAKVNSYIIKYYLYNTQKSERGTSVFLVMVTNLKTLGYQNEKSSNIKESFIS